VRNHEVNGSPGAFGPDTAPRYDAAAGGGTTTIQVTRQGKVLDSWTSLSGTMVNCSGGIMPWGSWITCEETINGPDVGPDFTGASNTSLEKSHGYMFDVLAQRGRRATAEPITAAGRFAHEAVSYDPDERGPHRRRVRQVDVQPGRRDSVRQHPGSQRDVLRDLGPLGELRLLRRLSR